MKTKCFVVFLISLLIAPVFLNSSFPVHAQTENQPPDVFFGVDVAYENGAKYILVFDSNKNYTQGTLDEKHLAALKQFWQFVQNNPRENSSISDKVAYVLPKDYGYGFRGPSDKIWGLWEADDLAEKICTSLGSLMEEYGTKLDIIYDEELEPNSTYGYSKLFFWNSSSSPSPTPQSTLLLNLPAAFVYTLVAVASVAVVGTWLTVYFGKRKKAKTSQGPL